MQKAVLLHTTHYSNPLKGSRDLRKFVVTGPQEHKFIVKTVYYVIRYNNNNNNSNNNNNNNNSNNNDNNNNYLNNLKFTDFRLLVGIHFHDNSWIWR